MRNGIREFFAAANTEEGFYSIFESVFPPSALDKIFIIKGGPGTGKSTLMRQIAEYACGRGYSPELYYCSSDTSSLDGIDRLFDDVQAQPAYIVHAVSKGCCQKGRPLQSF